MTQKERIEALEKKIAELEARLAAQEARPYYVPYPTTWPYPWQTTWHLSDTGTGYVQPLDGTSGI